MAIDLGDGLPTARPRTTTSSGAGPEAPLAGPDSWPLCGARTRGERAGGTCRAAGCGFGGRCLLHGGGAGGRLGGSGEGQTFVLFSSRQPGSRWSWWAVPLAVWRALPDAVQADPDPETVKAALRGSAAPWWPQELGFRVVKRLAERERIAFVLVHESNREALRRAMRGGTFDRDRRAPVHRVDAETFASSIAEAGQWPFRAASRQRQRHRFR